MEGSRASIVDDEAAGGEKRRSTTKRQSHKLAAQRRRGGCLRNWSQMMCSHRISSQRELYER